MEVRAYLQKKYGGTGIKAITAFAKAVGYSPDGVRKWIYHERAPRRLTQIRIAKVTGGRIGPEDWWYPLKKPRKRREAR